MPPDAQAIDLTRSVERYSSQDDRIQVSTAPGADGIVRRIEVQAQICRQPALVDRLRAHQRYGRADRAPPRRAAFPARRLRRHLARSRRDAHQRRSPRARASRPSGEDTPDADAFRITLDPGATITYVAELRTPNLPQLYLWDLESYKDKLTSLTLYRGIVIGIAGLLALFLTIVFVVKGAVIFPAAAALAWAVLAYVCIDFGFWTKLFGSSGAADRVWRAGAETILSATLVVFLFAYLNLNRWHVRASHVVAIWLLFLAALLGLSIYDAPVAAGVARISLATVAAVGFLLIVYLSTHGYDRAVMLMPTWFLLLVWVCAAAFTVTGTLTNDLVSPALVGGLVLIVMLIGFTVMQNAFAGGGLAQGAISDVERKALAVTGASDVDLRLGRAGRPHLRQPGSSRCSSALSAARSRDRPPSWLDVLHPFERDRYRACLDTVLEQRRGRIHEEFRLRAADGHYLWYKLKARPVVGADGEVIRVVGTLSDVTEERNAQDRLLQDAVHDNLTGLPNRELFFDRLEAASGLRPRRRRAADGAVRRHGSLPPDQRKRRAVRRRFDPADGGAASRAAAAPAGYAGAHLGRHVSRSSSCPRRTRRKSPLSRKRCAARCPCR